MKAQVQVFATQRLEASIRRLAGEHRRVFVRAWYRNTYPRQNLRANDLVDLPLFVHTAHVRDRDGINKWIEEGGIMLNYFPTKYFVPHCDAFVWCEAPFSLEQLEHFSEYTEAAVLIYKPYSWVEFYNTVADLTPTGADCERMYDYIVSRQHNQRSEHKGFAEALGITAPGVFAISDQDMCNDLFIDQVRNNQIKDSIKHCIGGYQYQYCIPMILRVEPQEPEALMLYRHIQHNCPKVAKWHVVDPAIMPRAHRQWKKLVRLMNRQGNIQREWLVYFYYLTGRKPAIVTLEREHQKAIEDIRKMEDYVNQLPTYAHE